jgi:hypothetical protein
MPIIASETIRINQSKHSHAMAILVLNLNVAVQVCTLKVHRVKFHMHYPFPSLYHSPRSLYPRAESDYELRHVCLSVRMEKRGSHWTDFHEIIYLKCFFEKVSENLSFFNPLNAKLNPICHLLALLGVHHFLHVSRIRVKSLTPRLLMIYIYIWSTYF